MTIAEVIRIAYNAGFRGTSLITAVAVAIAESKLDPLALGDINLTNYKWGPSVGLWQIRSLQPDYLYLEPVRNYSRLMDPQYNADAAYAISKKGTDFTPWTMFINGKYSDYLNQVADVFKTFVNEAGELIQNNKGVTVLLAVALLIYFISK